MQSTDFLRLKFYRLRVVINGKAGKAAALHKISDMVTLSQSGGADYVQPLALPHLKFFRDYAPDR